MLIALIAALSLLVCSCATKPVRPQTPAVQVPVTPPPEKPQQPFEDNRPILPDPKNPISEEDLGRSEEVSPSTPADRHTVRDLLERPLPARKKAALALVEEATGYLEQGQAEPAVRRLEKAIGMDPSGGYAYYYLGVVRFLQKRYSQVQVLCGQAYLKLRDDDYFAAKNLALRGEAYLAQGQMDRARSDCSAALALDSASEDALTLKQKLW